jgi:hypothetical protein
MAFLVPRSRCGAARRRAGAELPRSFLERVLSRPSRFSEASREHYATLYAQPGAMHAGFNQFAAFDQAFVAKGKLTMPVLAVGGEKFSPSLAIHS